METTFQYSERTALAGLLEGATGTQGLSAGIIEGQWRMPSYFFFLL